MGGGGRGGEYVPINVSKSIKNSSDHTVHIWVVNIQLLSVLSVL